MGKKIFQDFMIVEDIFVNIVDLCGEIDDATSVQSKHASVIFWMR